MISREKYDEISSFALKSLADNSIALTDREKQNIQVADFGLERIEEMGLQLITYMNTSRCCSKELVLMPWQICPEHIHPLVCGCIVSEFSTTSRDDLDIFTAPMIIREREIAKGE